MHLGGRKPLVHGKKDLGISEMFGITGQMIALVIMNFFRYSLVSTILGFALLVPCRVTIYDHIFLLK
jgi:hypothetical protein